METRAALRAPHRAGAPRRSRRARRLWGQCDTSTKTEKRGVGRPLEHGEAAVAEAWPVAAALRVPHLIDERVVQPDEGHVGSIQHRVRRDAARVSHENLRRGSRVLSVQLVDARRVERHQRIHAEDAERLVDIGGRHAEGEHARHAGQLLQHADVRYGMVEEVPGSWASGSCCCTRPRWQPGRRARPRSPCAACRARRERPRRKRWLTRGHHGKKPPVLKPIARGGSFENAGVPGNPPHAGDRDHSRDGGSQGRRQRRVPRTIRSRPSEARNASGNPSGTPR